MRADFCRRTSGRDRAEPTETLLLALGYLDLWAVRQKPPHRFLGLRHFRIDEGYFELHFPPVAVTERPDAPSGIFYLLRLTWFHARRNNASRESRMDAVGSIRPAQCRNRGSSARISAASVVPICGLPAFDLKQVAGEVGGKIEREVKPRQGVA